MDIMTQTNGTPAPELTLKDIIDAAEQLKRDYRTPPAVEYRIHPDDWAVLKKQIKPFLLFDSTVGVLPTTLFGMRIVLDETAERL